MAFRNLVAAAAALAVLSFAGAADAALVLAGSWRLNDGPANASAISGQGVAAQLFGGAPEDYTISTFGPDASDVDFQAWYLILGFSGGVFIDAQDATSFASFDLSAYAYDPALEPDEHRFVNYAFVERTTGPGIPEPATWALMIGGFGLAGAALRRRRATRSA